MANDTAVPAEVLALVGDLEEDRDRVIAEMVLDPVEQCTPALRTAIARRTLMLLWQNGLINTDSDDFDDHMRDTAKELNVPFVELWLAYYQGCTSGADATRTELVAWVGWCREHAPERLTAGKAVA
ncbi:MAG: hypothetical protein ACRERC_24815 [Candidatus Binatia bacterium]